MASDYGKDMYKQLMEVMARLDTVESDLKDEKSAHKVEKQKHKEDVIKLNKKIDKLETENKLLRNDNERLKSIINNDSSNTSLPPSTNKNNGKSSNTYNGRQKTNKKVGGQAGHKGTTLTKAQIEEKIKAGRCKHVIKTIGNRKNKTYISKYILDLDISSCITEMRFYADAKGKINIPKEYRSDVIYGSHIKALAVDLYSEGVMANDRIADFLNAASNNELELSNGSVYHFCRDFANKAENIIERLETELLNQPVVATDATVITVNGEMNFIRNFSIDDTVIYRAMKNKTITALKKLTFLEKFTGTLVHDHETALYHFGTNHGECNVHILRYLRKNTEEAKNIWSKEMSSLLSEMNKARKVRMEDGKLEFTAEELLSYENRYMECIASGREQNLKTKHKYAKKDELKLLNRMEKYQKHHLLFLHDFRVPFDDNMSERDLRKAKNRQKMAGGFRKESGNEMYCAILTIIETLKRRKMGMIENIKNIFLGTPAIF